MSSVHLCMCITRLEGLKHPYTQHHQPLHRKHMVVGIGRGYDEGPKPCDLSPKDIISKAPNPSTPNTDSLNTPKLQLLHPKPPNPELLNPKLLNPKL